MPGPLARKRKARLSSNIVYGVGLEDSEDHNQPGDEFRVVAPVGPVAATARSDGNHWSYSVLLNGDVGEPGTIPDGGYTVDFEVASQSPECSAGGVITGSYTVSIADDAPQVVLWWDWEWDAQNSPRGPEPDDQLISPGSAVRDASGAVAMWRVPAFDGAADSQSFVGSYSNVPVKLYVAWYGSITFDPDGSPEPSYLEPFEGVELCTGVVEKLTDAGGHLGYNSPVRTTCETPWTTFATAGASSDPVDTPESPAGPPDTWVPVGLGIGVTKGPEQPGRYLLVAEPLDPAFRRGDAWRVMSPFLPDGFVGFEVGGGIFLDENWEPITDIRILTSAEKFFHLYSGVNQGPLVSFDLAVYQEEAIAAQATLEAVRLTASDAQDATYVSEFQVTKPGLDGHTDLDPSLPTIETAGGVLDLWASGPYPPGSMLKVASSAGHASVAVPPTYSFELGTVTRFGLRRVCPRGAPGVGWCLYVAEPSPCPVDSLCPPGTIPPDGDLVDPNDVAWRLLVPSAATPDNRAFHLHVFGDAEHPVNGVVFADRITDPSYPTPHGLQQILEGTSAGHKVLHALLNVLPREYIRNASTCTAPNGCWHTAPATFVGASPTIEVDEAINRIASRIALPPDVVKAQLFQESCALGACRA